MIQYERYIVLLISNTGSCTTDQYNMTDNEPHYAARKMQSSTWLEFPSTALVVYVCLHKNKTLISSLNKLRILYLYILPKMYMKLLRIFLLTYSNDLPILYIYI